MRVIFQDRRIDLEAIDPSVVFLPPDAVGITILTPTNVVPSAIPTLYVGQEGQLTYRTLSEGGLRYEVALADGNENPLQPLEIQYADFAQWQRRWLQGEVLERQLSYWREQLTGCPPLLALPTDRPRPNTQAFRGSNERFALPQALSEKLEILSRQQGVTLYMTLLSGFAVLLGRYSGQADVLVGTPIANRRRRAWDGGVA